MGMDPNQPTGGQDYPPPPPGGGYPPPPGGGYPPPPGAGYAAPLGAPGMAGQQTFIPTAAPVPAGLGNLIQKMRNVTTRPGAQSFVNEIPTANWGDVWLALLGLGVLSAISGVIQSFEAGAATNAFLSALPAAQQQIFAGMTRPGIGGSIADIIVVPIGFFIGTGILWLIAKMFGGTGSFLTHAYAFMLFWVPIQAIVAVGDIIPFLGGLIAIAAGIYSIFLAVWAVSASHHLSTGRSVWVVLLPLLVGILLACVLSIALAALLVSLFHGGGPGIPLYPTP